VARKGTPTCLLDDRVGDVREKVLEVGRDVCIVINSEGIVQGRLKVAALSERPDVTAEEAMELGPTTVRPNEPLAPLIDRMKKRGTGTIVVTDLRGKLFGILHRDDAERTQ
jgi:CBS domain-containing protein